MKVVLSTLAVIFSLTAMASAKTVSCRSNDIVEGWNAHTTHDYVNFSAELKSNEELSNAQINGAFVASADSSIAIIKENPKSPYYVSYANFSSLEDAWCWYSPFLPKFMADLKSGKEFNGYMSRVCEGGNRQNFALKCVIE